ncbi:uncharacterized protein [Panulirus ornatus]|uniref:uncharacterized protein n=1 Tax=Panulirus ornatus TaxID=150431 RepID=UPI003A8387CF
MKLLVLFLAAACSAAPQILPQVNRPVIVDSGAARPAVSNIPEPGIKFTRYGVPIQSPTPVQYAVPPSPAGISSDPMLAPNPPMPSPDVPYVGGKYHAQDEMGQYSFRHWGGSNTRTESRDFTGRTSGSFAYVNPDGDVQVRKYGASPITGFKVAASDLPKDTPAVAMIKDVLAKAHEDARRLSAKTA